MDKLTGIMSIDDCDTDAAEGGPSGPNVFPLEGVGAIA